MKLAENRYLLTPEDLHLACDGQLPHYEPGVRSIRIVCPTCGAEVRLKGPEPVRGRRDKYETGLVCSGYLCWRGWSMAEADRMMVSPRPLDPSLPVIELTFDDREVYHLVQKEDMGRAFPSLELISDEEKEQRVVDFLVKMRDNVKAQF